MKTKQEIRAHIKSLFWCINREELVEKDEIIYNKIIEYIKSQNIRHICMYENMSDEVSTHKLIQTLRDSWYKIYTPQVISETEMILIDEEYGVYEKEINLFIVPWRAFTVEGKRLWRGKWYYDRFLEKYIYKKSLKIWICYNFQIMENIPTEKHDINMNKVIMNIS